MARPYQLTRDTELTHTIAKGAYPDLSVRGRIRDTVVQIAVEAGIMRKRRSARHRETQPIDSTR